MSVWYAIPSARPPEEAAKVLNLWLERGYKIALRRDQNDWPYVGALVSYGAYRGYPAEVNALCRMILQVDPEAEWIVTGGDDVEPDPNKSADEIAVECEAEFYERHAREFRWINGERDPEKVRTFGVMQPTGDPFAGNCITRICGSPWMGREFCRRMYGGRGPFCEEYRHMFPDEELQEIAIKLGVFWQRPDLTHYHHHFTRIGNDAVYDARRPVPSFLKEANSPEHWKTFQNLFFQRKATGFPGHEPIP